MKTQLTITQKSEKLASKPIRTLENLDYDTKKWFLGNLYMNDTVAWAKDYKIRIRSSEAFF